jgi:hypothetical protein
MARTALLNNVDHATLRVAPRFGAEHGDAVNIMLLVPTEFIEAQREFPILFRPAPEGGLQAVALLGLDRDENLFLAPEGWRSRYIPAVQRRGPFLIGVEPRGPGEPGEPMIRVDLDDPRVGAADGVDLFRAQGGNAPYLEHVAEALQMLHIGVAQTAPMFAAFEAEQLLAPVRIEIQLDEGHRYDLPEFLAVSAERLGALDGAGLERLRQAGFLAHAFAAVASLGNIRHLIALKNARRAAA